MAQRPTDQLVGAIQDFQDSLTARQNADFFADHSSITSKSNAVAVFLAHIDLSNQRRTFRCLASSMQGTLQSVEHFSKVVDTFVPSRPPIGAQLWGTLRFTVDLASHYTSFYEMLSEWLLQVQPYCPKLREYEFVYRDSFKLQEALCSFYAILVDFCTHAVHFIAQCGPVQHGKAFWVPIKKDFGDYAALIQRRHRDVKDELVLAGDQATQRDQQLQIAERQKAEEASKYPRVLRLKFDRLVDEDRGWKRQVQVRETRLRREKLLDKLSNYDHTPAYNREKRKRYGSTSVWLPRSPQFQEWIADPEPSIFRLSGASGSGKTVMATAIIDSLLVRKAPDAVGVAYFFCQYNKAESLKARTLLGSLMRQCLAEENLPTNHETYLDQILTDEPLNVEDTKAFFLKVVSEATEDQVIVIDGFDEMASDQRSVVLAVLRHVSVSQASRIKIFISGRRDAGKEIELAAPKLINRSLSGQFVHKDVSTYIKLALIEKAEHGSLSIDDNAILPIIEEMLIEKCHGNFLWAFFQIEELCSQKNDEDIYKSLAALPKDLPETFRRALRSILRHNEEGIAALMFFWAAAARRPLTLLEMREAIAIHDGQKRLTEKQLVKNIDHMVPCCAGLLVLDEEEQAIRFTHHTIRDYLFSVSEDPKLACFHFHIDRIDWDAGKACCTYLSLDNFTQPVILPATTQTRAETNVTPNDTPKTNGNNPIARSKSTLDRIRKVRPSSLGNIFQIMEEPLEDEEAPLEKSLPPAPIPKEQQHPFYAYASEYWLSHTSTIRKDDVHYKLWTRLVLASNALAPKPWTWKSRAWSEPEDPDLLQAIVELNHGALLDLIIEMHLAQTSHLPASPKYRSIILHLASRGTLPLFHRLLDHSSTLPFSLWGDCFDAAIAGGSVPIMKLLLQPDSWDTEPLRFSGRGLRLVDLARESESDHRSGRSGHSGKGSGGGNSSIGSESARLRIALAKERLAHTGPLAGLRLLMEMEAEREGTGVGYLELLAACKERDEVFVERILATGVDPRGFPRHEYRAIRGVMREKGEL